MLEAKEKIPLTPIYPIVTHPGKQQSVGWACLVKVYIYMRRERKQIAINLFPTPAPFCLEAHLQTQSQNPIQKLAIVFIVPEHRIAKASRSCFSEAVTV